MYALLYMHGNRLSTASLFQRKAMVDADLQVEDSGDQGGGSRSMNGIFPSPTEA